MDLMDFAQQLTDDALEFDREGNETAATVCLEMAYEVMIQTVKEQIIFEEQFDV